MTCCSKAAVEVAALLIFTCAIISTPLRSTAAAPTATVCACSSSRLSPWSSRYLRLFVPASAKVAALFKTSCVALRSLHPNMTRVCSAGGSKLLIQPKWATVTALLSALINQLTCGPKAPPAAISMRFDGLTGTYIQPLSICSASIGVSIPYANVRSPGQILSLVSSPPTRVQGLYFTQAVLDEFGSSRRSSSALPAEFHSRCESSFDRFLPPIPYSQ